MIVDMSTGDVPKEEPPPEREKNPAAVALGELGASKGGKARAGPWYFDFDYPKRLFENKVLPKG
jgi:hypothetical protein